MSLYDPLMLGLTFVIAISVVLQAIFARDMAQIAKQAERRQRENDKPDIRITDLAFATSDFDGSRNGDVLSIEGFTIRNASRFDVTIKGWVLALDSTGDEEATIRRFARPAPSTNTIRGKPVCDPEVPRRLRYGDTMTVAFRQENITEMFDSWTGPVARFRPQCSDSLGNLYELPEWIEWDPAAGRRVH